MTPARPYGGLDRLLHRLAFAGIPLQLALADVERRLYGHGWPADGAARPVFITALPRAGTTLLLELLSRLPEFAAHSYRQMPFVLCPLLWERISRPFRQAPELHERSHGDGVRIGYDSPEAFEEVVWKAHWPDKYRGDGIEPWSWADRDSAFEDFLKNHMRSIVALRRDQGDGQAVRYVSKNNANIGRIGLLGAVFPDCRIVVPLRDPLNHAASMLRQHRRFSELHQHDAFARRYMAWLGHHEFGANLKPIDFDGWLGDGAARDPLSLHFWVDYWYRAYHAVLTAASPNLVLVDYDMLCRSPAAALRQLAQALDLRSDEALVAQAGRLHQPANYPRGDDIGDAELLQRVQRLYRQLRTACVGGIRGVA